jgi:opacity protein-like surface antigen
MLHYLQNKLILGISIIMLIPNITLAENNHYIKTMVGFNKIYKLANYNNKYQTSEFSSDIGIGCGIGYIFNDTFRSEILVTYTNINFSNSQTFQNLYELNIHTKNVVINSTMLNVYKNLFQLSKNINYFIGVGIGVSQINELIVWETLFPNIVGNTNKINFSKGVVNRKITYNFSHALITGINFKVSDKIDTEFVYQFKNNGTTPARKMVRANVDQKTYFIHNLYVGFRYKL